MTRNKESVAHTDFYRQQQFYDGMITCSTFPGKLVCRIVWDMDAEDCAEYQNHAISGLTGKISFRKLFGGSCWTNILIMPVYQTC